jgi:serine/threonine protein kinase
MAPELFWSGQRTAAADVYSVGLTMSAIYNGGRLPFWPETGEAGSSDRTLALQKRLRGEDMPPPHGASHELSAVIMRSLSFRAEERWRDSEELRSALGDCSLSDNASKAAAEAAAAVIFTGRQSAG